MEYSTVLAALLGGTLIGLSAALLLYTHKHTAGISGIAAGILPGGQSGSNWRLWFLAGLISSAPLYKLLIGDIAIQLDASPQVLAIAGLLVGYGTRLGGGCTSGHGVCGIAQLSPRSLLATLIFMLTAGLVVLVRRHLL